MMRASSLIALVLVLLLGTGIPDPAKAQALPETDAVAEQRNPAEQRGEEALDDLMGPERQVPESRQQVQLSYAPLVKQVAPAVVNIYTRRTVQVSSPFANHPFWGRFFSGGMEGMPRERVEGSLGSGVIVSADGLIVTNNHVVGEADEITVVLTDRRELDAEVVLLDPRTDLALLRVTDETGGEFPYLRFSDSDRVLVGDIVLAIGNPFGIGQTVTSGIISNTARTYVGVSDLGFFLQTDAAINPGNSGGALIGLDGRLVGINTAIFSRSGENNGIGFAIPANMVRSVVDNAGQGGTIVRPWIGASGQSVTRDIAQSLGLNRSGGVLVNDIYPGAPADRAGLRPGDVILAIDDKEVVDERSLKFRVATASIEEPVSVRLYRDGQYVEQAVMLDLPPDEPDRDLTELEGAHPFQLVTVANLNPRFAEEKGLDPLMTGVIVVEMERRSPAARRQFVRPGDRLLSYNGVELNSVDQLEALLEEPTTQWYYELIRGSQRMECVVGNSGRSFQCRR